MKKISFLLVSIAMIFASCDKDDETPQIQISPEEAASLIATSLGADQGGLQGIFADAISVVNEVTDPNTGGRQIACGASDNTIFTYASEQDETPSYSFNYDYGWTLTCSGDAPSQVNINLSYDGSMESPDFTFSYEGNSGFTVTDIMQDILTVNGTHNQAATYNLSSEGQQYSGTDTFSYVLTDIKVSKTTSDVQSGTASVQLSGITNRGAYSISATIVYNGDGTATITINGDVFGVDISTGTING
jgi:hypothetical protein